MKISVFAAGASLAAIAVFGSAASAAVTLTFAADGPNGSAAPGQPDFDFERPGGYLDVVRGLPAATGGSHLVPIERAVVQVRGTNVRNGVFLPNGSTGLPVADGGTGVDDALTSFAPFAGNDTGIGNGVATNFTIARVGSIITFTLQPASGAIVLASDARASLGLVNAFEVRLRTAASSSLLYSNLRFTDSTVADQMLADIGIADQQTSIRLFEGIAPGDFALSGTLTRSWVGNEPNGSSLATQIKFLDVPPIPEPATWAMMIAGFGMVGAAARRRRIVAA